MLPQITRDVEAFQYINENLDENEYRDSSNSSIGNLTIDLQEGNAENNINTGTISSESQQINFPLSLPSPNLDNPDLSTYQDHISDLLFTPTPDIG